MSQNEYALSKKIQSLLSGENIDVQAHEDRHSTGIPDLSFGMKTKSGKFARINGWIELKHKKKWPKKAKTPVRFGNFTNKQKSWLKKRGNTGGSCFVLFEIEKYIFLYSWTQVSFLEKLNKNELYENALFHCHEDKLQESRDVLIASLAIF